jgi:hypothetical protein
MMLSFGKSSMFINYLPALSPHQWPPGTNPSTASPPPTLHCCHRAMVGYYNANTRCYILYRQRHWQLAGMIPTKWHNSWLPPTIASRQVTPEQNRKEACWMVQRGRWLVRQHSNGYQSARRCVSNGYCWSGMTGRLNWYHLLRGSWDSLVITARGFGDGRVVSIYLKKNIVRKSGWSTKERGKKTFRCSTGIEGSYLTIETKR